MIPRPSSASRGGTVRSWSRARILRHGTTGNGRGPLLALGVVGLVTHQVAEALVPVLIGTVIDRAVITGNERALVGWLAAMSGLFIVLTLSWRTGARCLVRVQASGAHDLRLEAVRRLLHPSGLAARRAPGEVLTITSSDVDRVSHLAWSLSEQAASLAAVTTAAVFMLRISSLLALVVLIATPIVLLVMHWLSRPLEERTRLAQEQAARAGTLATDFVDGLRVLKGIGAEGSAARRYRLASRGSLAAALRAAQSQATYGGVGAALSTILLAVIALLGALATSSGQIEVGELITIVGLAQFIQGPMTRLGMLGVDLAQSRASAGRVAGLLNEPPGHSSDGMLGTSMPPTNNEARLRVVGNGQVPALPSLEVRPGEMLGLVLAKPQDAKHLIDLLGARIPSPSGRIFVGDSDIAHLGPEAIRQLIFVAHHDAALFTGTVVENLVAGTDRQIDPTAVSAAAVDDVAAHLHMGIDTLLIEQGKNLSGGQRQRVVLGRALHQPQPIIVLHGSTTSVDTVTEARIAAALRERRGRTLVVVATSPTLLAACDRVVALTSDGAAVTGTHASLIQTEPAYREMLEL